MVTGKLQIIYSFERADDKKHIPQEHKEELHQKALERAMEMYVNDGYLRGELCEICLDSAGKEVEYRGYWEITKKIKI